MTYARVILSLLLLGVSSAAAAQQVIWKCRTAKGAESFQNVPCEPGTREVRAISYEPIQPSSQIEQQVKRTRDEMDQRNAVFRQPALSTYVYSPPTQRDMQKERCKAARADLELAVMNRWSNQRAYQRAEIDACFGL